MSRPAARLGTAAFSLLLALGASQALAPPAAKAGVRACPPDCNAYCRELYGPESSGRCTLGGCLCMQPGT
ncbi:MAG TPA: hypothetical protein VF263_10405 [Longimicrobiaceae bacterium]